MHFSALKFPEIVMDKRDFLSKIINQGLVSSKKHLDIACTMLRQSLLIKVLSTNPVLNLNRS